MNETKLAEASALRSGIQKRLAQLKERAVACARYQKGEPPAEAQWTFSPRPGA